MLVRLALAAASSAACTTEEVGDALAPIEPMQFRLEVVADDQAPPEEAPKLPVRCDLLVDGVKYVSFPCASGIWAGIELASGTHSFTIVDENGNEAESADSYEIDDLKINHLLFFGPGTRASACSPWTIPPPSSQGQLWFGSST